MASVAYQPENEAWISPQEAAEMEERDDIKYEWLDGCVYAMAGATLIHNRIAANLMRVLGNHLQGTPCEPFGSDMKICVRETGLRAFPDIVVACQPHQWDEETPNTLLNPLILIEILSPSTKSYDQNAKWRSYNRIESLQEYLLIETESVSVQHYRRQFPELPERNDWYFHLAQAREETLQVSSINYELSLQEIYERVAFESD